LRILKQHYARLSEAALSDYFIFVLERFLPSVKDLAELEEIMLALDGCEVMGVAGQAADLTIETMSHLQGDLAVPIDTVIGYLRRTTLPTYKESQQATDRVIYSDWLIASFCKALVYQKATNAFAPLSDRGWYASDSAAIRPAILHRMNREANFAFGDWFRQEFPAPIDDYLALVSRAAESKNVAEREAAFFMIRHTRATHKMKAVRVDRKFKGILEKIAADPDLKALVSNYEDFFRVNQIGAR
jgi:hypothetical protein